MLAVEQLVIGFQELGWNCSEDHRAVMHGRSLAFYMSQFAEDVNNVQKNDKTAREMRKRPGQQHFRRPETCWMAAVSAGVADRIQNFKRVSIEAGMVRKNVEIGSDIFASK